MTAARRDPGGTPGGLGEFVAGVGLLVFGALLLLDRVQVMSGGWFFGGVSGFGISLIPVFAGVVMLFLDARSLFGKVLAYGGLLAIFAGILSQLRIFFQPTSLYNTLIIRVLMAAGTALVIRSLRDHGPA